MRDREREGGRQTIRDLVRRRRERGCLYRGGKTETTKISNITEREKKKTIKHD